MTIDCELVGHDKTYKVKLDIQLKPIRVNEEADVGRDLFDHEQLTPGQDIPDGNYLRRAHQFDRQDQKRNVRDKKLYAGWVPSFPRPA